MAASKLAGVLHLRDADARAEVGRLDEHRTAERALAARRDRRRGRAPSRARSTTAVVADRQAVRGEDDLHHRLVHADGRGEHAGADVGHVGELQQALDRAVLAVGPVQDREDDVEVHACDDRARPSSSRAGGARSMDRIVSSLGRATRWTSRPARGGRAASSRACSMTSAADIALGGRVGERPAAVLLDADRHRLVALAIEVREDRRGRGQRHLVLARPAAVDDADAKTFHERNRRQSADVGDCRNSRVAFFSARAGFGFRVTHRDGARPARRAATRRTGRSRRRCSCRSARAAPSRACTPRDLAELGARDHPRQHLSPLSASGRRADRARRRPAPLHRLGRADPDRQRRLSGLQPRRRCRLTEEGARVPLASRRLAAPADAGVGRGHPGAARRRHRHGARRVHRARRHRRGAARASMERTARWARARARPALQLRGRRGRRRRAVTNPGRRSSASSRAASYPSSATESARGDDRRSASRATPSAGSASASRST